MYNYVILQYLAAVHTTANIAHIVQRLHLDCLNIDDVFPRKQPNTPHMLRGLTLIPPKLHLKLNVELLKETNPYNTVMQPAKAAIYT